MPGLQTQDYLFQLIKKVLSPDQSLPEAIADVLHISQDSAYRRIRGETMLVLEEAKTLCQHYNISLDQLLTLSGHSVVFETVEIDNKKTDFRSYLQGILQQVKSLAAVNRKSIIYLTKDVPIFHQFCFKPVIAFRYFFWMKTIFQHPDFVKRKFSQDCLPADVEALSQELLSIYCTLPSIEIWNTESINSLLTQIHYHIETGNMSREDAQWVYSGLRKMLEHLEFQTEHGRKFLPGDSPQSKKDNFRLFYNRIGLSDTTILTLHDESKTAFINYDVLNYIFTTDENFCNQVHQKLQTIMRRSTLISGVSEKQRNIFFNILYAKLPLPKTNKTKQVL